LFEKHLFSAIQPFCPEKTLSVAKLIAIRVVKHLEIGILGEVSIYAQNIFLNLEAGKIPQESYFFLQIHHAYFLSVIGGAFHDRGYLSEAERWFKKAAEKREYQFKELPMYYLWVACRDQGKHIEAKEWLRKAAENGSDRGMYDLGNFYEREGDLSNAKKLYEQAASQELKEAIAALGNLYYVQGNFNEAINWYEAAASQGHVMSMNNLGSIYFRRGEESRAIPLFEQAATFNNKEAICNLGISCMKRSKTK
jgi:TPR repeat protein